MKLFVPEPQIELYKHGFEKHDLLGRKEQGNQLSDLVEKISDPMVIALDGQWGSGKSVFLKCWVGEHTQSKEYTSKPIYFDAFQHDFMSDPLIALVSVLDEQIQKDKKAWKTAKLAASKLLRLGARVGLAVTTAGATEIAGTLADAAINTASNAAGSSIDNFWKAENSKRDAITNFREALTEMGTDQKLVIVIDELDRCRPDFALSMLEIIKHLFSVPNIHFVLGVNLNALENTVKARYGQSIDATKYLTKFFQLKMTLASPTPVKQRFEYFAKMANIMGLKSDKKHHAKFELFADALKCLSPQTELSFRDINKIITELVVLPLPFSVFLGRPDRKKVQAQCVLILIRTIDPPFFRNLRADQETFDKIMSYFKDNLESQNGKLVIQDVFKEGMFLEEKEPNDDTSPPQPKNDWLEDVLQSLDQIQLNIAES